MEILYWIKIITFYELSTLDLKMSKRIQQDEALQRNQLLEFYKDLLGTNPS